MAGRGKTFELLDFPKFAAPSALQIDAAMTSVQLVNRLGGKSFMSYAAIWSQMRTIVNGAATDRFIEIQFDIYEDEWKNEAIRDATRLLNQHFGGRGRWYPFPAKPLYVLGFWFKPSIKGVWFVDGQAYAVLVNARKGQRLLDEHVRFLTRGVYELHCVDDPNDPIPLIVDLSEPRIGEGRRLRVHNIGVANAITLEQLDRIIREFVNALKLAGVTVPSEADAADIVSLFKKK
jgi:hypothetical protein